MRSVMARPARASSAVAVTLLLTLPLLLLPAPASSQAAAAVGAFLRLPPVRQFGKTLIKEAATTGGQALVQQAFASASASASASANAQLGGAAADNAAFMVYSFSVGPPAQQQTVYGIVDILSAFLRVQCPPAPAFSRVTCESKTCMSVLNTTGANCNDGATGGGDCLYVSGSASGTNTTGYLAEGTLTVRGGNIAGDVVFGCSTSTSTGTGDYGAIGFNQGNLSFLRQLQISRFSYFLTTDESASVILVDDQAVPQTTRSLSTRLFGSNAFPDLYYVELTSLQVDGVPLPGIPAGAFDLAADGNSGGVVLSTTTLLTYLQQNAYYALKQALVSKIRSQPVSSSGTNDDGFDLCYYTQSVAQLKFPKITLVFAGPDSPSMELTTVHYFYRDNLTGLQCLTILPTPDHVPFGSILGSMLQAGTNMIFDVRAGVLTFENGVTSTVPSQVSLMVIASQLLVWVILF